MNRENFFDDIVEIEWSMMKEVNNISGTTICQKDEEKFEMFRKSQFELWSTETLESYKQDLIKAIYEGRNLVEEKYAYMMENTDSEYYATIVNKLPPVSDEKLRLIRELTDMVIEDEITLSREYPMLTKEGRPIFSEEDSKSWASVETYHLGELKTYSKNTLSHLKTDYVKIKHMEKNIAKENLRNIVKRLGYSSLDEAEKAVKAV